MKNHTGKSSEKLRSLNSIRNSDKMIHIITGHRGAGKSLWLKTVSQIYGKKALCFDLDREVENEAGKSVSRIFEEEGEKKFRSREREVFARLLKTARKRLKDSPSDRKIFIAAGAGLIFKKEKDMRVVFLRRVTDSAGRVFLNRPRLFKQNLSPFEEYLQLYEKRLPCYKKQADETLFRKEYFKMPQLSDRVFLGEQKIRRPFFILRLNPADLPKHPRRLKDFLEKRRDFGTKLFELNDETADTDFIKKILRLIPPEDILFSSSRKEKDFPAVAVGDKKTGRSAENFIGDRRRQKSHGANPISSENSRKLTPVPITSKLSGSLQRGKAEVFKQYRSDLTVSPSARIPLYHSPESGNPVKLNRGVSNTTDTNPYKNIFQNIKTKPHYSRDLKLGQPPKEATILSLHERDAGPLKNTLRNFSRYKNLHLKLAVEIFTLRELWEGLRWQKEDPLRRSFLPRSRTGRWRWFRNAFPMPLHFIREGDSEVLDQPFFAEACHYRKKARALSAVIGDPVDFSATPAQHNAFFYRKRSIPVLPVPLKEEEMTKENLKIFKKMGFVFFAVTSPLKKRAFRCADILDKKTKDLKSVNLLICHREKWRGYNTDGDGLSFLKKYRRKNVVVWGGGGVLSAIKKHLPEARFYSARRGAPSLSATRPDREQKTGTRRRKSFSTTDNSLSSKSEPPESEVKIFGEKVKSDEGGHSTKERDFCRVKNRGKEIRSDKAGHIIKERDFCKAKTHRKKTKSNGRALSVDVLIWAVGRSHIKRGCVWPPEEWRPAVVQDLNYTDDSPGREYALKTGAVYKNGLTFFKAQAKKQQEVFAQLEKQAHQ